MANSTKPLPFYKEPLYYSGLVAVIAIGWTINAILRNATSPNIGTPIIIAVIFSLLTYYMWNTKCPNCKRIFSKQEQMGWKEDLGIKKEPYTYYSRMYKYSDGSVEPILDSKKTIVRDKKYDMHYFVCKICGHGSQKEWTKLMARWVGQDPVIEYVKKKGGSLGFGTGLFEDDSYNVRGQRKTIPKGVKEDLWLRHFGKKYFGNCTVCGCTIETKKFEAGHIVSVADGGSDNISNLKPLCMKCNRAMGTMNLNEYRHRYYCKARG